MQSTDLTTLAFSSELTEQGLKELKRRYPKSKVPDMTIDENYKQGRQIQTEANKLTSSLDTRRKDLAKQLKLAGDDLIAKASDIYAPYVSAYKAEQARRKEIEDKKKREREALLNAQRAKIAEISRFVDSCKGASLQEISDCLEAVNLIDTSAFDPELIHEAIEAVESTIQTLWQMHTDTKQREELAAQQAELEKQLAVGKIALAPTEMIGKSSDEISAKITELQNKPITEEFFADAVAAEQAVSIAISQLKAMHDQALQLEEVALQQAPAANDDYTVEESTSAESTRYEYKFYDQWPTESELAQSAALRVMNIKLGEAEDYIRYLTQQLERAQVA
ncbi:hypothetical protein [Pseudoalteromonas umbrosa]|uniref:hypothetical protein n=1 Tax=Pseudoalteromonas umbrosa TaxID=3048489 RepID=UPI0024C20D6F|nr:hypothetical protein [Pseudoalteromonas sp. B95]MDK1289814.1 hypothetical protein [Pseudoalteromonas sp. B95]